MLDALRRQVRLAGGRDAESSAGIIDSQTVQGADTVGRASRGYERDPATSEAMIRWAAINTMIRCLARGGPATRPGPFPLEYE
jgi:hypothetical protein